MVSPNEWNPNSVAQNGLQIPLNAAATIQPFCKKHANIWEPHFCTWSSAFGYLCHIGNSGRETQIHGGFIQQYPLLIHSPEWIVFRLRKNTLEIKLHLPVTWWVAEFGTDISYAKASMDFKQTKIEILGNPRTTLYKQKWIVIRLNLLEKFCRWWKLPIVKRDSYHSNLPLTSPFNLQEREKDEDLFHPSIHPLVAKQG